MATVFQECTIKEQHSVMRFLLAEGLNAKDIHKEMFNVYGGKCLSHKAVHSWVENSLKDVQKSRMMPDQVWKWLKQQAKDFWVSLTGKAMGQVYQCWWSIYKT
jgi:hypothetical protein